MTDCDLETSTPEWLIEHPELLAFFEERGIDYCCGGKSLRYACEQRGLDPDLILTEIRQQLP